MTDPIRPGGMLGRFYLEEELGQGAAGTVYRAKDTMLGTVVALKVIHSELIGDSEVKERFKREIMLSRRVQHRGVCRVFDLHEIDQGGPVLALAMELLSGRTLAAEIHEKRRLTARRTLDVMEELVPALAAAHEAGVVHRDLKPGNIIITNDGHVKLLDFGMAIADDVIRVTRPGNTVGSLRFIAPEVWEGEPASPLSDVYALGVTMFACLSGRLPYEARTPAEMFNALKRPPPALSGEIAEVTPAMDAIILKAMARRPPERYRSGRAFLDELRRAVTGEHGPKAQPTPREVTLAPRSPKAVPQPVEPLPTAPFLLACAGVIALAIAISALIRPDTPARADASSSADAPAPPQRAARDVPAEVADAPPPNPDPARLADSPPPDPAADPTTGPATDPPEVPAVIRGAEQPRPDRRPRTERNKAPAASEDRSAFLVALKKRGITMADLPDVEALDQRARKQEADGDSKAAAASWRQAKSVVEKAPIDRGFIVAKQKRLMRALDTASQKTREKVRPIEADIQKAFAARDYEKANALINRALSAAR